MSLQLFKKGSDRPFVTPDLDHELEQDKGFSRIRCPLCDWSPKPSSLWACEISFGTPEPPFYGCGTMWNTFLTRGVCPGCSHKWQWTSCLNCHGWSRHEDWYEVKGDCQ